LTRSYRPVDAASVGEHLAEWLVTVPVEGAALRVAVDGPPSAAPHDLAAALVATLLARGRRAAIVSADTFWRDASLRLEYGREDVDSFLTWLDADALRREVLDPLGPRGDGHYLPSLRHPASNRATREPRRRAEPGQVVIVAGALLLGAGLPFDATIHLAMSSAARARRTVEAEQWTLLAFDRYDAEVAPAEIADVALRVNDPTHPVSRSARPPTRRR
jgi:hypothetical protein